MAWFWTDDLAYVLIDRDGVSPDLLGEWLSSPMAYRSDLGKLEFARELMQRLGVAGRPDRGTSKSASNAA